MTADDLLGIATDLVQRERGRPRQSSLKRAAGTAYYALFHAFAHECVAQTVGWRFRSSDYWDVVTPVSRAMDHAGARSLFRRLANDAGTSPDVRVIAQAFIDLQAQGIRADYDPTPTFVRSDVAQTIDRSRLAVDLLRALPDSVKRHLVVQLITKPR